MPVYTEAKIRRLFKELGISDHGIFEMEEGARLTPAAKSFLSDHHIQIVHSHQTKNKKAFSNSKKLDETITHLEDSAVYPLLFQLTRLYPYFLKNQRELHLAFQNEKCEQIDVLLSVIEQIVGHRILEDLSDYHSTLAHHEELQATRVMKQLDQQTVAMRYDAPIWQLVSYETYLAVVLLRKELELQINNQQDPFAQQVIQLLKAIEVSLWTVTSE